MDCIEALIRSLWSELLRIELASPSEKFTRMTYSEAMARYGSDKPDLRTGVEISRFAHLLPVDLINKITPLNKPAVDLAVIPTGQLGTNPDDTRRFINQFLDSAEATPFNENPDGGPGIFVFDSRKPLQGLQAFGFEAAEEVERLLDPAEGDLILLQARKDIPFSGGSTYLGRLIAAIIREAIKKELIAPLEGFKPLWVTDFPLFSPISESEPGQGGAAGLASTHHPFTSPKTAEDVDLLTTSPLSVIGDHYDLVINGVELGGGSRRIHNAGMQRFVMEEVLKMSPDRLAEFSHLLEVLRAGCPPHAGFALGFDRLVAVMLGKESVRDVIAFPKSGKGEDLLVKSPGVVDRSTLERYHLRLVE